MSAGLTLDIRNFRDWVSQARTLKDVLDDLDTSVDRIVSSMNRLESATGQVTNKIRSTTNDLKTTGNALGKVEAELKDTSTQADKAARNLDKLEDELHQAGSQANSAAGSFNKAGDAADNMGDEVSQSTNQSRDSMGRFTSGVLTGAPMIAAAFVTIVTAAAAMAVGIGVSANKAYIEWESAFAGVVKTVDGTSEQLDLLEDQIRAMATDSSNPVAGLENAAVTLAQIAEQGGQLGVPLENLQKFTETIAMLRMAAPTLGDEAAQSLAQFANIVQMPLDDIDRLASTVVHLGNNMATTEPAIVEFMHRLAGAGDVAGFTESEIAGLAAAMASVGLNPEAGGSAMTMTLDSLARAVGEGGEALSRFAEISGLSADEFSQAWREEPVDALFAFIQGIGEMEQAAQIEALDELGLDGIRTADTLRRLAGNTDLVTEAFELANAGWEENNALQKEAAARFDTTEAQINLAKNQFRELGYTIGEALNPYVREALELFNDLLAIAGTELTDFFESVGLIKPTPQATAQMGEQNDLLSQRADLISQIAAREAELGASGQALDTYIVKAGDSLGLLANRWGTTVDEIKAANPELDRGIQPGDELKNPTITLEVEGDEQLEALRNELTATENAIKNTRDEAKYFGNETTTAGTKTDDFKSKIQNLVTEFDKLSAPIQEGFASAIGEFIKEIEAIDPQDVENIKFLAQAIGLFIGVFVGIPVAIAGIAAIGSALLVLNLAANSVEPTIEILSGLGEALKGIKDGDPEQIANGLTKIANGLVDLNVGAVEALGEMGITIVQFFADIAGIDVNIAERVQAAMDGFALIPVIIEGIGLHARAAFDDFRLKIAEGANSIIDEINEFVNGIANAPDSILNQIGIDIAGDVSLIDRIDTSGLVADTAQSDLAVNMFAGTSQADMVAQAQAGGDEYARAYTDAIIGALSDPALGAEARGALLGTLSTLTDGEGFSIFNELSAGDLFGEDLTATLRGLDVQLSSEADGALNFQQIQDQIQEQLDSGALEGQEVVIAVNAKLELQQLMGEEATLGEEDAGLLAGMDLTSMLPEGAPLLEAGANYGLDLQTGMAQGITDNSVLVTDAAAQSVTDLTNAYTTGLQIQSPSQLTYGFGMNLNEGLALALAMGAMMITPSLNSIASMFVLLEMRAAATSGAVRASMTSMAGGVVSARAVITDAAAGIVSEFIRIEMAAKSALAAMHALAQTGIGGGGVVAAVSHELEVAGGRASGGPVSAGNIYRVLEPSTGGAELFRSGNETFLLSGQDGRITPPVTAPQNFVNNTSSPSIVFSPQIAIGANAGVTEGQVRGIFSELLDEMARLAEPSQFALERAGY